MFSNVEALVARCAIEGRDVFLSVAKNLYGLSLPRELYEFVKVAETFYSQHESGFEEFIKVGYQKNFREKFIEYIEAGKKYNGDAFKALLEVVAAEKISALCYDVIDGKRTLQEVTFAIKEALTVPAEEAFVQPSFDDVLGYVSAENGLHWRLHCLNRSLGPIRKGDFIVIGARVETGKTTLLASEVSFMMKECRKIIWFNNEEATEKVIFRVFQSAFGVTRQTIMEHQLRYAEFYPRFLEKIKFSEANRVNEIEAIIDEVRPDLVVFDMLDKVYGFEGEREDIMYAKLYQWARSLAKEYCPVITTTQLTGEAEGRRWLNMNMLAGSRVAKQKEADAIILIGRDEEPNNKRYVSIVKNKLSGDENTIEELRHGRFTVYIDAPKGRYYDTDPVK